MLNFEYHGVKISSTKTKVNSLKLLKCRNKTWREYKKRPESKALIKRLVEEHGEDYVTELKHDTWVCKEIAEDIVKWMDSLVEPKNSERKEDHVAMDCEEKSKPVFHQENEKTVDPMEEEKIAQDPEDDMDLGVDNVEKKKHLLNITVQDLRDAKIRMTPENKWISTFDSLAFCQRTNPQRDWDKHKEAGNSAQNQNT